MISLRMLIIYLSLMISVICRQVRQSRLKLYQKHLIQYFIKQGRLTLIMMMFRQPAPLCLTFMTMIKLPFMKKESGKKNAFWAELLSHLQSANLMVKTIRRVIFKTLSNQTIFRSLIGTQSTIIQINQASNVVKCWRPFKLRIQTYSLAVKQIR